MDDTTWDSPKVEEKLTFIPARTGKVRPIVFDRAVKLEDKTPEIIKIPRPTYAN